MLPLPSVSAHRVVVSDTTRAQQQQLRREQASCVQMPRTVTSRVLKYGESKTNPQGWLDS